MVNKILRAGNQHEKEYVVSVNKPLNTAVLEQMAHGVPILGVVTKKCKITQEGPQTFRIILVQGLNRQIRRMCEYFGYEVTKLERVRIMNISLKGLPVGDWRDLTPDEMAEIYALTADSSSEDKRKQNPNKPSPRKPGTTQAAKSGRTTKTNSTGKPNRHNPDKRNRKSGTKPSRKSGKVPRGRR
jgi:23S rRNA pseudouridine2604 synthase